MTSEAGGGCGDAGVRREHELRSLHLIAQALNFDQPLDDVLELIYTQLQRVIPTPNFCVLLLDREKGMLRRTFVVQKGERLYLNDAIPLDSGLAGVIARTGIIIRTDDYVAECRRRGIEPMADIRSWMGVPLPGRTEIIGVMGLAYPDGEATFTEEDESFLVTIASYTASAIERRRLQARLEARAHQLKTLNEIGRLLASSLNIDEVLELVVRYAASLLNAEGGSLLLLDEDSGDLIFRISSGPAGEQLRGMKVPAGRGIAGRCFSSNQPIIANDVRHDSNWYRAFDQQADFVTRSILAVPLSVRGRTIGVLEAVNRKDGGKFNKEDAELLLSFGSQAAIAIENARLFTSTDQALRRRVEELTFMQHIDRQLNATLDYQEVMSQTLDWALRISHANIGLIAAFHDDEEERGLQFLAHKGYPEEIISRYTESLWSLDRGLIGWAVQHGEASLITDVADDPRYEPIVPGMRAQLTLPIRRESRVIGVLALESKDPDCFDQEALESINRLIEHAAIAIDNARLFQQVQRANQAKTEFISFVSHELKQPMTSMKGYVDLLMKGLAGPLTDQQRMFLQVVRSNVERMNRLVSDLLDISRLEAGRLRLEMRTLQPEKVSEDAVNAFRQPIEAKGQTLHVEIEPDLPPIYGDHERLVQVLTNLLSNAHKYTPEGGEITFRVRRWEEEGKSYVRWDVIDSGIGISEEDMKRLFTKFFRSSNPRVRDVKGTGLGLTISRSIVELHGGRVEVESELNKGSTFSVLIPVSQEPPADSQASLSIV